jgi:biopolymer transport protein ExbB/TolQ
MESPYTPPTASELDTTNVARSKRLFGRAAMICGLGVVVPPLIGLVGTVKGMVGAFAELGETGTAELSVLAGDISVALLTTFWGLIFSVISLIPFIVFLVLFLKRRKILRALTADQTNKTAHPTAGKVLL